MVTYVPYCHTPYTIQPKSLIIVRTKGTTIRERGWMKMPCKQISVFLCRLPLDECQLQVNVFFDGVGVMDLIQQGSGSDLPGLI